jgi:integral membrane protein
METNETPGLASAWAVYRTMAIVVGTVLAVLTFVALPYRYLIIGEKTAAYSAAWIAHGWIFPVYVVATFWLSTKLRWPLGRTLYVMVAGTIPLLSFFVERKLAAEIAPVLDNSND